MDSTPYCRLLVLAVGAAFVVGVGTQVSEASLPPPYTAASKNYKFHGCDESNAVGGYDVNLVLPLATCLDDLDSSNNQYNITRDGDPSFFLKVGGVSFICDDMHPKGLFNFSIYPENPVCSYQDPNPPKDSRAYCFSGTGEIGNYIGPASFRFECVKLECNPHYTLDKKQCSSRIKTCERASIKMKWTGKGCRNPQPKRAKGDGGCQCNEYCGYQCKKACSKDKQCYWNATSSSCWSKAVGFLGLPAAPGFPILKCPYKLEGQ